MRSMAAPSHAISARCNRCSGLGERRKSAKLENLSKHFLFYPGTTGEQTVYLQAAAHRPFIAPKVARSHAADIHCDAIHNHFPLSLNDVCHFDRFTIY